jgi:hypothetical protein
MIISKTSLYAPYSVCDWFIKDIAVALIKYGYEFDTAFNDWSFPIRLHRLKTTVLSLYFHHRKSGIL